MVPSLASDQVFYEDKTDKESLKQVNNNNNNNNKTQGPPTRCRRSTSMTPSSTHWWLGQSFRCNCSCKSFSTVKLKLEASLSNLVKYVFQALAEHLVGERVVSVNFQFFRKPPGGLPTPPHQVCTFKFKCSKPLLAHTSSQCLIELLHIRPYVGPFWCYLPTHGWKSAVKSVMGSILIFSKSDCEKVKTRLS